MLTFEQTKGLEEAFGADKAAPLIGILQDIVQRIDRQKVAVKADLLLELATKADIARLEGKIETDIARLEGKLESEIARLEGKITGLEGKLDTSIVAINGELKSLRLWMKLLVAVGLFGMSLFSPFAVKLLEFIK